MFPTFKGQSENNASIFYFMLLTSGTYENFTQLYNNVADGLNTFQCGFHVC
jgi:hypothetical protein